MVVGEVIHDMDVAHGRHEPCDGVSRAADIREVFADDLRAEADDLNVFDSALEEDFAQALEELRIALPVGDEIERVNAVVGVHVADVGPRALPRAEISGFREIAHRAFDGCPRTVIFSAELMPRRYRVARLRSVFEEVGEDFVLNVIGFFQHDENMSQVLAERKL